MTLKTLEKLIKVLDVASIVFWSLFFVSLIITVIVA